MKTLHIPGLQSACLRIFEQFLPEAEAPAERIEEYDGQILAALQQFAHKLNSQRAPQSQREKKGARQEVQVQRQVIQGPD